MWGVDNNKHRKKKKFTKKKTAVREIFSKKKRFGAAEARWAHNPKVRGSKPRIATNKFFFLSVKKKKKKMKNEKRVEVGWPSGLRR